MKRPEARYKLLWWNAGDTEEASGEEDFDLTDHPVGHPMDKSDMSKRYQELYESPEVYKLEIWQFFAGFHRQV